MKGFVKDCCEIQVAGISKHDIYMELMVSEDTMSWQNNSFKSVANPPTP